MTELGVADVFVLSHFDELTMLNRPNSDSRAFDDTKHQKSNAGEEKHGKARILAGTVGDGWERHLPSLGPDGGGLGAERSAWHWPNPEIISPEFRRLHNDEK